MSQNDIESALCDALDELQRLKKQLEQLQAEVKQLRAELSAKKSVTINYG